MGPRKRCGDCKSGDDEVTSVEIAVANFREYLEAAHTPKHNDREIADVLKGLHDTAESLALTRRHATGGSEVMGDRELSVTRAIAVIEYLLADKK